MFIVALTMWNKGNPIINLDGFNSVFNFSLSSNSGLCEEGQFLHVVDYNDYEVKIINISVKNMR